MDMLIDKVNDMVEQRIRSMDVGRGDDFGLDRRAGSALFTDGDYIVVYLSEAKDLDYYGGFEYVDSEYVTILGDYKMYSRGDSRVADAIDAFENITEDA